MKNQPIGCALEVSESNKDRIQEEGYQEIKRGQQLNFKDMTAGITPFKILLKEHKQLWQA